MTWFTYMYDHSQHTGILQESNQNSRHKMQLVPGVGNMFGFVLLLIGWENSMFGLHSASSKSMLPNRPFYQYSSHFDFYWFEKHYRMLRGHISMYLPPMHPIISIGNNGFQNGCCIGKMVYLIRLRSEVSSTQLLVKKHHQWGKS